MTDMTVAEAARQAGVSERTMRRWIRDGRVPGCYKRGGRVRIPAQGLRETAAPYDTSPLKAPVEPASGGPSWWRRPTDAELLRAKLAFERIDEIRARGSSPSGPDDTAVAYIRDLRDGPPRWERDIDDR